MLTKRGRRKGEGLVRDWRKDDEAGSERWHPEKRTGSKEREEVEKEGGGRERGRRSRKRDTDGRR